MPIDLVTLRCAALGIWALWILIYWWGGIAILLVLLESLEANRTRLDAVLLLVIMALAQPFLGIGVWVCYGYPVMRWADNLPITLTGFALVLIGAVGSTYCRYAMRHLWTAATNLRDEHRVIESGLWSIVRHPLYGFIFVMYLGTAVLYSIGWEWLFFVLMIAVHLKKLVDEERFLREHLPGYGDYMQRVRYRILPGVW